MPCCSEGPGPTRARGSTPTASGWCDSACSCGRRRARPAVGTQSAARLAGTRAARGGGWPRPPPGAPGRCAAACFLRVGATVSVKTVWTAIQIPPCAPNPCTCSAQTFCTHSEIRRGACARRRRARRGQKTCGRVHTQTGGYANDCSRSPRPMRIPRRPGRSPGA